jgi:hypothetical protein
LIAKQTRVLEPAGHDVTFVTVSWTEHNRPTAAKFACPLFAQAPSV